MTNTATTYRLKSGYEMPVLGLGTWGLTGQKCTEIIRLAVDLGYTHIDTAEAYDNEADIGKALKGLDRETLFITSKAAPKHFDARALLNTCEMSLEKLETDYLDLYLLHWPNDRVPLDETLESMQQLVEKKIVRSAGLSNYDVPQIKEALSINRVPICNLQIEYNPHTPQEELPEFCRQEDITITAYSPLARGKVINDETIQSVAEKCGKSPAQVSLRWLVQKGAIVIPKSSSEQHLRENMQIFDWFLEPGDMERIEQIQHSQHLSDTRYS